MEHDEDGNLMIKSLKNTYPLLYKKAVEYTGSSMYDTQTIMGGFGWSCSYEHPDFWENINSGRFEEASKLHPELVYSKNIIEDEKFNTQLLSNIIEKV
jgi:hypothetical protein